MRTKAARLQDEFALAGQAFDRAETGLAWLLEDAGLGDEFATAERIERAREKVVEARAKLETARDAFTALTDPERASVSLRSPIL